MSVFAISMDCVWVYGACRSSGEGLVMGGDDEVGGVGQWYGFWGSRIEGVVVVQLAGRAFSNAGGKIGGVRPQDRRITHMLWPV